MKLSERLKQENMNLEKLSDEQLEMVSGGVWWTPVGFGIGIAITIWDATDDFIGGMKEAYNEIYKK